MGNISYDFFSYINTGNIWKTQKWYYLSQYHSNPFQVYRTKSEAPHVPQMQCQSRYCHKLQPKWRLQVSCVPRKKYSKEPARARVWAVVISYCKHLGTLQLYFLELPSLNGYELVGQKRNFELWKEK